MSAPDTKLTAQTNPELASTDSFMTFHTGSREVLRITNEARLIVGEGLSKDEATQEIANMLIVAFDEQIQKMLDKRVASIKSELEKIVLIAGQKADSNVELRLRAEKAEDETLVWRNRFASILWSGALGKSTVRDFKKWEAEYKAEQNALTARAEKAEVELVQLRAEVEIRDNRIVSLRRALKDAISTYSPDREETLVTAERQEAWIKALNQ